MNNRISHYLFFLLMIFFLFNLIFVGKTFADAAGIKLPQTRVVFNSKNKNAVATIQNKGDTVYLVKASVLADPYANNTASPFMVTPPLFRLEPHNQQTVRIIRQGTDSLPVDRESIFYLSFLAIPSTPETNNTDNRVAVGLQTVIKLFYRPTQLAMTPEQAAKKLQFQHLGKKLIVENPTPYYLTLGSLNVDGTALSFGEPGQMIAPFSQQRYPYTGTATEATWTVINDYGGLSPSYTAAIITKKDAP